MGEAGERERREGERERAIEWSDCRGAKAHNPREGQRRECDAVRREAGREGFNEVQPRPSESRSIDDSCSGKN